MTEEDGVSRAALLEAASYALGLDGEAVVAEAVLEFLIVPGGPDREDAVGAQRGARGGQAGVCVERRVARLGKGDRAVVDVEQHGVEVGARLAQDHRDVAALD